MQPCLSMDENGHSSRLKVRLKTRRHGERQRTLLNVHNMYTAYTAMYTSQYLNITLLITLRIPSSRTHYKTLNHGTVVSIYEYFNDVRCACTVAVGGL